jgi:hypothetical protein
LLVTALLPWTSAPDSLIIPLVSLRILSSWSQTFLFRFLW